MELFSRKFGSSKLQQKYVLLKYISITITLIAISVTKEGQHQNILLEISKKILQGRVHHLNQW